MHKSKIFASVHTISNPQMKNILSVASGQKSELNQNCFGLILSKKFTLSPKFYFSLRDLEQSQNQWLRYHIFYFSLVYFASVCSTSPVFSQDWQIYPFFYSASSFFLSWGVRWKFFTQSSRVIFHRVFFLLAHNHFLTNIKFYKTSRGSPQEIAKTLAALWFSRGLLVITLLFQKSSPLQVIFKPAFRMSPWRCWGQQIPHEKSDGWYGFGYQWSLVFLNRINDQSFSLWPKFWKPFLPISTNFFLNFLKSFFYNFLKTFSFSKIFNPSFFIFLLSHFF